jgi:hypothetical protein
MVPASTVVGVFVPFAVVMSSVVCLLHPTKAKTETTRVNNNNNFFIFFSLYIILLITIRFYHLIKAFARA